jgi:hypothetical protein
VLLVALLLPGLLTLLVRGWTLLEGSALQDPRRAEGAVGAAAQFNRRWCCKHPAVDCLLYSACIMDAHTLC